MRRFVNWWHDRAYSATGTGFDIGATTGAALARSERTGDPLAGDADPAGAGNRPLMRLARVVVRGMRQDDPVMRASHGCSVQPRTARSRAWTRAGHGRRS